MAANRQIDPSAQRKVWLTALVAGMASYIDSAAITAFATSLIVFQNRLGLLPQQLGLAGGTLAACMAIGAAVGGRLGDRFGRRPVFVVTMLAIIAGALLLVWGRSFEMVLIGTAIVGAAVGADLPVSLATIAETADDSNRGRMLAGSNVLWLCGIIGNGVLAAVFGGIGDTLPVILFGHIIVVSMVVTCGRLFVPESRVWLAARANRAGGSGASAKPVSWLELFRPPFRAPFLGLCLFYGLTNILANTYSQYMSYILVKFAGFSISSAATLLTSSLPLSLLGYLWFAKVADQRNRLTYFKFGAVCFVSAPLVIAIFGLSTPTVIAMLLLKAGGISFAFEGIYRIWAQQAFSTLLRTTAQGTILAFVRALAALSAFVAPSLIASIGVRGLFATMAVTTAAGVLIGWAVFRHRDQESVFGRE